MIFALLSLLWQVGMPWPGPGTAHSSGGGGGPVVHAKSTAGYCAPSPFGGNIASACASPAVSASLAYTANATGNGLIILVSCAASTAPSAVSLTSTGWTFTQVGAITGSSTAGWVAGFKAYTPNTSAATFALAWTSSSCGGFENDLIEEFSGVNGTSFVDNSALATNTTGGCNTSITPVANNTAVWSACNDSSTGAGTGYSLGANDTQGDIAIYKILTGGAGASQSITFTGTTGAFASFTATIKP